MPAMEHYVMGLALETRKAMCLEFPQQLYAVLSPVTREKSHTAGTFAYFSPMLKDSLIQRRQSRV